MQVSKIFHISEGREFPLIFNSSGPFRRAELPGIRPAKDVFHAFLLQCEAGHTEQIQESLKANRHLDDYPKIIVLPNEDYRAHQQEISLIPRALVLDDEIRPHYLRIVLEQVLQQEYYRQLVYRLSHETRQRAGAFENLLELARSELQSSKEENQAYKSLVEYEADVRRFDQNVQNGIEEAHALKGQELVTLKTQLEAMEKLSDFRDQELKRAHAALNATEKVLDMSRKENIERDRIIAALDHLRIFTDKELHELVEENAELRKKLGLPARDI